MRIDQEIHNVYQYFNSKDIRWHDFRSVGIEEDYYDYYYAESRLYVIRDRCMNQYYFVKAGSPAEALKVFKDCGDDISRAMSNVDEDEPVGNSDTLEYGPITPVREASKDWETFDWDAYEDNFWKVNARKLSDYEMEKLIEIIKEERPELLLESVENSKDNNSHIQELRKNVESLCGNCDRPSKEELGWLILSAMEKGYNLRPKGHWEAYGDEHFCSVCKGYVTDEWYHEDDAYDYCPWCGADMRGEQNE